VLQCVGSVLQCVAGWCSASQCGAVRCSVLLCVAVRVAVEKWRDALALFVQSSLSWDVSFVRLKSQFCETRFESHKFCETQKSVL